MLRHVRGPVHIRTAARLDRADPVQDEQLVDERVAELVLPLCVYAVRRGLVLVPVQLAAAPREAGSERDTSG